MRSKHNHYYNHDNLAGTYDRHVQRTDDPIRDGYEQVLDWVIANTDIDSSTSILELGSGTGNLTRRIGACSRLICVDISTKMEAQGADKVAHLPTREFLVSDVLEYVLNSEETFDAIISTYTLHHLTEGEKSVFLKAVVERLSSGGSLVVGDLMTESEQDERDTIDYYRSIGDQETAEDMEEEFFWYVDTAVDTLEGFGMDVETIRFSRLSWCFKATKPGQVPDGRL